MRATHREAAPWRPLRDFLLEFRLQVRATDSASYFGRFWTYNSLWIVSAVCCFFTVVDGGEWRRPDTRIIQGALRWAHDGTRRTHVLALPLLLLVLEEFEWSWGVSWIYAVAFQRFERLAIENVSDITIFLASLVAVVV